MTGHIYRDVILEHIGLFRGAMGAEFLFMDDNARPHRANIVDEYLQSEDITLLWKQPKLKQMLKGIRFSTDAKVQAAMRKWIRSQPESFYVDEMKKWIERLNRCEAVSGDYVEK
ncbi:transposable element Tcb1 transposase [Trichonephila clavipes]|nr:transposable element Tcb1 transposase [Trichonephila clavipes]